MGGRTQKVAMGLDRCGRGAVYATVLLLGLCVYVFLALPHGIGVPITLSQRSHTHYLKPAIQPNQTVPRPPLHEHGAGIHLRKHRSRQPQLRITYGLCRHSSDASCQWERQVWSGAFIVSVSLLAVVVCLRVWNTKEQQLSSMAPPLLLLATVLVLMASLPALVVPLLSIVSSTALIAYRTVISLSLWFYAQRSLFVCLHGTSSDECLSIISPQQDEGAVSHLVVWPYFGGALIAKRSQYLFIGACYVSMTVWTVLTHVSAYQQLSSLYMKPVLVVHCIFCVILFGLCYCHRSLRVGIASPTVIAWILLATLSPFLQDTMSMWTMFNGLSFFVVFLYTVVVPVDRNAAGVLVSSWLTSRSQRDSHFSAIPTFEIDKLITNDADIGRNTPEERSLTRASRWETTLLLLLPQVLALPLLMTNMGGILFVSPALPHQTASNIEWLMAVGSVLLGWALSWMVVWMALRRIGTIKDTFRKLFVEIHQEESLQQT